MSGVPQIANSDENSANNSLLIGMAKSWMQIGLSRNPELHSHRGEGEAELRNLKAKASFHGNECCYDMVQQ